MHVIVRTFSKLVIWSVVIYKYKLLQPASIVLNLEVDHVVMVDTVGVSSYQLMSRDQHYGGEVNIYIQIARTVICGVT
jgi:hypothetical protein